MNTLCFEGYYNQRFGRVKAFCHDWLEKSVEDRFAHVFQQFCNEQLEYEYSLQSGAARYERTEGRIDRRNGHYFRQLVTARGKVALSVPRGENRRYRYSLFDVYQRYTEGFEEIVLDALIKGHTSRNASRFFGKVFGKGTISHQAALSSLRKCDEEIRQWTDRSLRNNAVVVVLDAIHIRGAIPYLKRAKPVLFAYAVYADGHEEVLDYQIAQGESTNAWYRFTQRLWERGLKNVSLVVHDDNTAITEAISFTWPRALNQQCVFHILKNFGKKLAGDPDKEALRKDASWLYEASSEEEFFRWVKIFKKKWAHKQRHRAIQYLFKMMPDSIQYFQLPRRFWTIGKTSNRLERLFEELRRRISVFRRFQNTKSVHRWLYALIKEHKHRLGERTRNKSQHNY